MMSSVINFLAGYDKVVAEVKYDPWSKDMVTKDTFFHTWTNDFKKADLEKCWASLHTYYPAAGVNKKKRPAKS